jgi:hypothetical protein
MKCSKFKNETGSKLNINNSMIQGLASSPKCKVLNGSSKLRLPFDLPVFRWGAGSHKFAATFIVLRHFCTQLNYKQTLSN